MTRKQSVNPAVQQRRALYSKSRWKKLRKQIILRDPVCTICRKAPSEVVDHIEHDAANSRFFDPSNLRGTCATCNNRRGNSDIDRPAYIQTSNRLTEARVKHEARVADLMARMRNPK